MDNKIYYKRAVHGSIGVGFVIYYEENGKWFNKWPIENKFTAMPNLLEPSASVSIDGFGDLIRITHEEAFIEML